MSRINRKRRIQALLQILQACSLILSGTVTQAQELLEGDIYALMSETTVSVASRTAESIIKAPARVTVFTRRDIEALGVQNLFDLLEQVPGFSRLANFHDVVAYANGLSTSSFMIYRDGSLIRDPIEQRYHSNPPYIDLGNVERVEVMHGSGSVLYGQGAAAGVVQLISRRNENHLSLGAGSHGRKRLVANLNTREKSSGLVANLSLQSQSDNGRRFSNLTPVWGYSTPTALNLEGRDARKGPHELELQLDWQRWTFNAGLSHASGKGGIVEPTLGLSPANASTYNTRWLRLGHELAASRGWAGKVAVTWREFDQSARDFGYPGAFSGADSLFLAYAHERSLNEIHLEAHGEKQLNPSHDLQFGLEARQVQLKRFQTLALGDSEHPQPDPTLAVPNPMLPEGLKTHQSHVYLQYKAQWTPHFSTNAGLRHMWHALTGTDAGDKQTSENSYRLAASFQPDPQHSFKLIHNQSFDLYNIFHAVDNPYSFSKVRATELVYEYNNPRLALNAGFSRKTYTQVRDYALFDGSIDSQTEEFSTTLAEIGATVRLSPAVKLNLNATRPLHSESNDEFSYFVHYQPSYTAAAALTYRKAPYTASLSLAARGSYDPSVLRPGRVEQKTEIHANVRYELNRQATLVLSARNLTGAISGWAEPVGVTGSLFFPSGRGREFYLGVEYQW
ncbi:MAG: TonB-dependent receptor [Thiothrix sp.]|nr:TonB-dependent receptor [Thiothrix sp.]